MHITEWVKSIVLILLIKHFSSNLVFAHYSDEDATHKTPKFLIQTLNDMLLSGSLYPMQISSEEEPSFIHKTETSSKRADGSTSDKPPGFLAVRGRKDGKKIVRIPGFLGVRGKKLYPSEFSPLSSMLLKESATHNARDYYDHRYLA